MADNTKDRLLNVGMGLLLKHGYNDLGIQTILKASGTPKGSFYHHFQSKEDFALQAIDRYMAEVHQGLDDALSDPDLAPLDRVRRFFEISREKYSQDGYLGCMLGGLGQELSGISEVFASKIDECFGEIGDRLGSCFAEARDRGDLTPDADPREMAELLLNCWEGAALRSRLRRDPRPLEDMLDFYFAQARSA